MGLERKVSGNDYVLSIDPYGGTAYKLVVCLKGNSIEFQTNVIDASSKCGPDTLPGNQSVKCDFSFLDVLDTQNTEQSGGALIQLQQAKTTIGWKWGRLTPQQGDYVFTGTGFIGMVKLDAQENTAVSGTGSIGIYGTPTITYTGS